MSIVVIPARGGSKRIPRKNIQSFYGQPMIAWSIQAALQCDGVDEVWVSTDDEEIAAISAQYGANTPFVRPAELANDHATTADVMQHAVQQYQAMHQCLPEFICCLYATAPFVQAADLQQGLSLLQAQPQLQYVFSATSYPFPIQRAIKRNENGQIEMFEPQHFNTRSQDLPEAWHDAGQFYWGTAQAWQHKAMIFAQHSQIIELPRYRVQDIDTPEDWRRAELMAASLLEART